MSNRALTPEFEMSEMAPTTVTASVLANLGFMALELHEARDAAVRMKPNWKICNTLVVRVLQETPVDCARAMAGERSADMMAAQSQVEA